MLLGWHYMAYYANCYAFHQYLASRGYTVLSVNYRSGTGYGMGFREALNYGASGASEFGDVLGAGRFLADLPGVDQDRVGLWGGSYGGYLTALGLSRASDLFAAGVDIHGVHDWNRTIQGFIPELRTPPPSGTAAPRLRVLTAVHGGRVEVARPSSSTATTTAMSPSTRPSSWWNACATWASNTSCSSSRTRCTASCARRVGSASSARAPTSWTATWPADESRFAFPQERLAGRRSLVSGAVSRGTPNENETHARAVVAGKKAGEDFSAAAWMVGGVFLGLIMPLISHAMRKPEPPATLLVSMSGDDRLLFADAYGDAAKSKRNRFSWIGDGYLLRAVLHALELRRLPRRDGVPSEVEGIRRSRRWSSATTQAVFS